ncbi:putative Seipin family protein [Helianthus annuus]|nr:putative Seipin family protein [Helianthus annuus]
METLTISHHPLPSSLPRTSVRSGVSSTPRSVTLLHLSLPHSQMLCSISNRISSFVRSVRVDFLSSDGNVLASTRQPCMLRFKSQPIRLVSNFLKLASLLTRYSSETHTLDMKFRGYIEKDVHTSGSRVVIEQRAEFARRGSVPKIYSASLKIESRLPFVKRNLWYSKWLIYMWISVTMYIMELLFTLLCCRSIIFPWEQSLGRDLGSSNDGVPQNKPNASS